MNELISGQDILPAPTSATLTSNLIPFLFSDY